MNKKIYNINDIHKNIINIKEKLQNKNMLENFWILIDRSDFKPLINNLNISNTKIKSKSKTKSKSKIKSKSKSKTKINNNLIHSINDIKKIFLNEKSEYYINKKFVCIKIIFNNKKIDNLENIKLTNFKKSNVIAINIQVYIVDDNGNINNNNWKTNILISIYDLQHVKFKLKTIEMLARIISEKSNVENKIKYCDLFEK